MRVNFAVIRYINAALATIHGEILDSMAAVGDFLHSGRRKPALSHPQ
jgi:hypothetical protein